MKMRTAAMMMKPPPRPTTRPTISGMFIMVELEPAPQLSAVQPFAATATMVLLAPVTAYACVDEKAQHGMTVGTVLHAWRSLIVSVPTESWCDAPGLTVSVLSMGATLRYSAWHELCASASSKCDIQLLPGTSLSFHPRPCASTVLHDVRVRPPPPPEYVFGWSHAPHHTTWERVPCHALSARLASCRLLLLLLMCACRVHGPSRRRPSLRHLEVWKMSENVPGRLAEPFITRSCAEQHREKTLNAANLQTFIAIRSSWS